MGSGAEAKPGARNVPVSVGGVTISPVCFHPFADFDKHIYKSSRLTLEHRVISSSVIP